MYNVWELANINSDFSDPKHNVDDIKAEAIMIIDIQIPLHNFKTSKKVDIIKIYLFQLLKVYLVNDLMHLTMSTLNKREYKKDK